MTASLSFALCLTVPGPPLLAGEVPQQAGQTSHTELLSFAPGGIIRFRNSFGDLYVEGWDRPEVEISSVRSIPKVELDIIKSPEDSYKPPEDAASRLERVGILAERASPNELAISTTGYSHNFFAHPLGGHGPVNVRYEFRVPRSTHLVIQHRGGNILVGNVTGGIEATNRNGDIVLMLPGPGPYAIDARSRMGAVSCDFAGKAHARYFVSEKFASAAADSPNRIHLRVGFGGITIKDVPSEAAQ
jgi:hypothetical protein